MLLNYLKSVLFALVLAPVLYIRALPKRLYNFFVLFAFWSKVNRRGLNFPVVFENRLITWVIYLISRILDLIGVWYLLEVVLTVLKPNTRTLTRKETEILHQVWKSDLSDHFIRIDERSVMALIGKRYTGKKRLGVTTFHRINFTQSLDHNKISDQKWLLHEMVHIKQMISIGSCYIIEALVAQHREGYKYKIDSGKKLADYNLEQQAEIISDAVYSTEKIDDPDYQKLLNECADGLF